MTMINSYQKTLGLSGVFLILGFFLVSGNKPAQGALKDQIEAKQREIKKVEQNIQSYTQKVTKKQTEIKTLSSAIDFLNQNISKTNTEIKSTEQEINKLESAVGDKVKEIGVLEQKLNDKKEKLKTFLVLADEYDKYSMVEVMLKENNLSDFLNQVNDLESIETQLTGIMEEIKIAKTDLEGQKFDLEGQKEEQANLQAMKEDELNSLKETKNVKSSLLSKTKGQEQTFKDMLAKNQALLPQLRDQLLKLQSLGIPINYNDARAAALSAAQITGVRSSYLMGVLKVESDLGNNIGGGNYLRDMAPAQRETFKAITAELGFDPKLMPVSRRPSSYSGWGGAMGPAQIMPTTWQGSKAEIASLTGHNPPNPWNLGDAMVGMALKLSNVDGVIGGNRDSEYKAAAVYFAGSNWQKFTWYADRVMFYADLYEQYNQSL